MGSRRIVAKVGDGSAETPAKPDPRGNEPNTDYENLQFFFHSDHLGSTSYMTDLSGEVSQHVEYFPYGGVMTEERTSGTENPYLFNGKELDMETGLYYYGARYMEPSTSIWYGVDPLAEKYPNMSGFAYTAGNPIRFIDPDGRSVSAADEQSKTNIKNTLTKSEARFVKFNKNGGLKTNKLNRSKSTSENMTALKELASSETNYIFSVAGEDINGSKFFEKGSDPENSYNFFYGVTNIPGAENDPSPNDNVYIFTASFLDKKKQTSNTAHEGYGHAYFYELKQQGRNLDPYHRPVGVLLGTEWNEEFKMDMPVIGSRDSNIKLNTKIKTVEQEALKNYRSRKK